MCACSRSPGKFRPARLRRSSGGSPETPPISFPRGADRPASLPPGPSAPRAPAHSPQRPADRGRNRGPRALVERLPGIAVLMSVLFTGRTSAHAGALVHSMFHVISTASRAASASAPGARALSISLRGVAQRLCEIAQRTRGRITGFRVSPQSVGVPVLCEILARELPRIVRILGRASPGTRAEVRIPVQTIAFRRGRTAYAARGVYGPMPETMPATARNPAKTTHRQPRPKRKTPRQVLDLPRGFVSRASLKGRSSNLAELTPHGLILPLVTRQVRQPSNLMLTFC